MTEQLVVHGEAGDPSSSPSPGRGERHPEVARFLAAVRPPIASRVTTWGKGDPIRTSAYVDLDLELPDVVVSSVRCIVRVDDYVVVCCNADHIRHAWPGGTREAGETFEETACREVHEETGWLLDPTSLRQIGWLHVENLAPVPAGHRYPHPDAFHAVFVAEARSRAGDSTWTDTQGYELSSELVLASSAARFLHQDPLSAAFLERVLAA